MTLGKRDRTDLQNKAKKQKYDLKLNVSLNV